jgi:hypothetical protein
MSPGRLVDLTVRVLAQGQLGAPFIAASCGPWSCSDAIRGGEADPGGAIVSVRCSRSTLSPSSCWDEGGGMRFVICPHCGVRIAVDASREPVQYVTREADSYDPASFVVIGNDWLLHRCVLPSRR